MDFLERAKPLLLPHMGEDQRDSWLTLAFHGQHRDLYDAIAKTGAPRDFTVACVRTLLDCGCLGSRHALSLLLEVLREQAGDEKQSAFDALIGDLDASCERPLDPGCPYRDLRAFREQDAPYFFGRETFTEELVAAVDRRPFVAVVGPSGSGKSSVVQAGLIPVLRGRGSWEVGILRPGRDPWRSLAGCLLGLLQGEPSAEQEYERLEQIGEFARNLKEPDPSARDLSLHDLVERLLAKSQGLEHLLLVVDQWEELYTYKTTGPPAATHFADVLMEATASSPVTVVLTLRADFTGRAIEHRPLRDRLQEATVFLGAMTRAELEQAVTGPAQRVGLDFEPGLVGRILDAVGGEPGNLPLLEFCLSLLCARRQGGHMRQAAYEAIGGVQGAIVRQADTVIDEIEARDPGRGEVARDVFLQLVQLGEGTEDTRRRAVLREFGATARPVVTDLATARLVVTGRDPGGGQETVEVAHEALIRRWPRLQAWLDQDRDDLYLRREVGRAAAAWAEHGEAHRWSDERVIRETAPALRRLASRFALTEPERRFLGPLEPAEMLSRLREPSTSQAQRASIGERLALLPGGDPRPGVGLLADGMPDIAWHAIPGGEVELEIPAMGLRGWLRGGRRFRVEPVHVARHPITVAQWRPFLEAGEGYDALVRRPRGWEPDPQRGRDNQPAVMITWIEALAYCQWLSTRLGYEVRLPTEWEWQQAATGGDPKNQYPWGKWEEGRANTFESEIGRVTAVGLYPHGRSAQGVPDLAGNVMEWCLNRYDSPKDVRLGGDARRVVRGGSWGGDHEGARCAFRLHYHPVVRDDYLGFRVVCVSPIP
jgi:formylglycine-generating enzyme required for sulfatase activity